MTGSKCVSVTEKLAGALEAIIYKSRGTRCWRGESLPGGCPADSTRYEQILGNSLGWLEGHASRSLAGYVKIK